MFRCSQVDPDNWDPFMPTGVSGVAHAAGEWGRDGGRAEADGPAESQTLLINESMVAYG